MLELENYKIMYQDKTIEFKDMNIADYEFIGLSGNSGCGKTSLLNSLFYYDFAGKVSYSKALLKGKDIKAYSPNEKYKLISYCPQFCQDALNPKIDIHTLLTLTLKSNNIKLTKEQIANELAALKLDNSILNKYPNMLSGGQKQRLILLLCVIKAPELLILDEPSSALDSITLKTISEYLIQARKGKTIIMVSHNKDFLFKISDRVISL